MKNLTVRTARQLCLFVQVAALAGCPLGGRAESNADPDADGFNYGLAAQSMGGLYQFTTNSLLRESADALAALGANAINILSANISNTVSALI